MKRKFISIILLMTLIFTFCPYSVFAEDEIRENVQEAPAAENSTDTTVPEITETEETEPSETAAGSVENAGPAEEDTAEEAETTETKQEEISGTTDPEEITPENEDGRKGQSPLRAAARAAASVSVETKDESAGTFVLKVENISLPSAEAEVVVPTWSRADQSDIVWYKAEKKENAYYVSGSLSRHKYHLGKYYADVYISSPEGMQYIGGTTMDWSVGCTDILSKAEEGQTKADLSVSGVKGAGVIRNVVFAVWSTENGQDDLKWYSAEKKSESSYEKQILLSAHRGTGTYIVHCYANTLDGSMVFLKGTSFSLEKASAKSVTVSDPDPQSGSFTVTISGVNAPSGIEHMVVPVWCSNDQSDIVWYPVKKQGKNYVAECSVAKHKYHTGVYKIDVYVNNNNNTMECISSQTKKIQSGYTSFEITDVNGDENQFDIKLTGLTTFGAPVTVYYAVWSKVNGQDDLKWYKADNAYGTYDKIIRIADHKSGGLYYVDCYVRTETGSMGFVCGDTFEISYPQAKTTEFTAEKSTGNLYLNVGDISAPSGIKKVEAEIWCKADKSDLVRYSLTKSGKTYSAVTNISKHGWHTGEYSARIIVTDGNEIVSETALLTADMSVEGGKLEVNQKVSEIRYPIYLRECDFCTAGKSVVFAIWSDKGGQDDLVWYPASEGDGGYTAVFDIVNHMTNGKYYVDAYVNMKDGSLVFAAGTTFSISSLPKEKAEIVNVNAENGTFDIQATILRKDSSFSGIVIPTWCSANQSDLVWYEAEKQVDGTWIVHADIQNHSLHFGTYKADVYVRGKDGSMTFVSGASYNLQPLNYVVSNQISDCLMQITVYGAAAGGQAATSVMFPTWSLEDGQDDLKWHKGTANADGSFTISIYRSDHSSDGTYVTDIYTSSQEGSACIKRLTYNMAIPTNYDAYASSVMRNIIFAVETGGQVYGNARYDEFAQAYKNTPNETAITIGAGGWFATEAKRLLNLIRSEDPETFARLDTAGIGEDLDTQNWQYYGTDGKGNITITKDSAKALCIKKIISSETGIAVQNRLLEEQMLTYVNQAVDYGVTDLKARMFCANIRHLGGLSAMKRVINNCLADGHALTMDNLWQAMLDHDNQNESATQVGSPLFHSRHKKVMAWLNKYIG